MSEEAKKPFDPDATVSQPVAAEPDPEATIGKPERVIDLTDPGEDTFKGPAFDPDKTFNPAEKLSLDDPDATIRIPSPGKPRKKNPFAPRALPESLQANLGALGGINPLVALANPIIGAVPEIRHTLRHRDPAALKKNLVDQLKVFQLKAEAGGASGRTVEDAVYAIGALLDDAAGFTPWGHDWPKQGVLQEVTQQSDGAEGFFARLDHIANNASVEADLLELYYVCLALGFEGRYRGAPNGRRELSVLNDRIYAAVSGRRKRPVDGLSERWRSPMAATPAQATAPAAATATPGRSFRNMPRQAKLTAALGAVATLVVVFMLGLRIAEDDGREALRPRPGKATKAAPAPVADPAASAAAALQKALEGEPLGIGAEGGRVIVRLNDENQYRSGSAGIKPELKPLLAKIGKALETTPGAIVVTGHADPAPIRSGTFASNADLSVARAQAAARDIGAALSDAKRVSAEGKGDAEPLAQSDTAAERAKNRRIVITLTPSP